MTDTKIDLALSGSEIFIWSADGKYIIFRSINIISYRWINISVHIEIVDWLKLRQEHRILGDCIGCIAKKPRQDYISGLPMLLLPEEAKLLIEKGIGRLIQRSVLKETPSESLRKKFEEYRSKLYADQQECLIDRRRIQVLLYCNLKYTLL